MQCRKAVGPTWGFKPATMRWIYEVMVRPVLGYGLNGTRTQHNEKLLNGVQRLANVLITGAMPSTPGVARDNWEHTHNTMARGGAMPSTPGVALDVITGNITLEEEYA